MTKQKTVQQNPAAKQDAVAKRKLAALSNDAIKEAKLEACVQAAITRANELSTVREKYETETLARSNRELYGILGEVLQLIYKATEDDCLAATVSEMRTVLTDRGVRVQNNTPAVTVFVRYVFNSDRKRSYNYTCTLLAALKDKIKPEQLADFIESKHGVEECKRTINMKPEALLRKQAIEQAALEVVDLLRSMPGATTVDLPDTKVALADGAGYAFVIARKLADGRLELLRTIPVTTKGMQTVAVKELAKDLITKQETAMKNAKAMKEQNATAFAKASRTTKQLEAA